MEVISNIIKGALIGGANVIPGVSGGTMAVLMGIYDKIIYSVTGIFKDFKKSFIFLVQLGIGAILGIGIFIFIIPHLMEVAPLPTNFFFMGLVLGAGPMIYKKAKETNIKTTNYIWFIIALVVVVVMGIMREPSTAGATPSMFMYFISGFIAAATMILPGVSGSFMLLLLGMYKPVLEGIKAFDMGVILPVGFGIVAGFVIMTKLIETMFKKYPQTAYCIILGLVIGSVVGIYNEIPGGFVFNMSGIIAIVTFIIGLAISLFMGSKE